MYVVPYKDRDTKRVWEISSYTEEWQDTDGSIQTSEVRAYTFKKGVFYVIPRVRRYNWSSLQMHGCSSKKQIKELYGYSNLDYYRVLGGEPQMIVCSKLSVLDGVIPPFKRGHGCCNYSMGEELLCECGNNVGHMYLDCYEDNTVEFIEKKVTRNY
jgi:hypothetical protein